jgi:hypothetical protein
MMVEGIRKDAMMAYLTDALEQGRDIGHFGRLVFAMVARHFGTSDELIALLTMDATFDTAAARALIAQVEAANYIPPKRAKILEFQARQAFPIIPDPDDPDCGNVYRDLMFPDEVYDHIAEYREAKVHSR